MNQNLIFGGIYTMSDKENIYYVFIEENKNIDRVLFVKLKVENLVASKYNSTELQEDINRRINFSKRLRNHCISYTTDVFMDKYDGFLGVVNNNAQNECKKLIGIL